MRKEEAEDIQKKGQCFIFLTLKKTRKKLLFVDFF